MFQERQDNCKQHDPVVNVGTEGHVDYQDRKNTSRITQLLMMSAGTMGVGFLDLDYANGLIDKPTYAYNPFKRGGSKRKGQGKVTQWKK